MGVLMRRNAIIVFMCIELMLNAVNLLMVAFSKFYGNSDAQIFVFFIMVVAAAEVAALRPGVGIPRTVPGVRRRDRCRRGIRDGQCWAFVRAGRLRRGSGAQ